MGLLSFRFTTDPMTSSRFESLKRTDIFPTQKTDRAPQTLSVFFAAYV